MARDEISIPEGEELEAEMAKAGKLVQANVLKTEEDMFRLIRGAKGGRPEEELLEIALGALDKCVLPEDVPEAPVKGTGT